MNSLRVFFIHNVRIKALVYKNTKFIIDFKLLTNPFGGTFAYNLSLCCTDVMAPRTDNLFTRDLMFEAVPYSSANIFDTRAI